jgi:hypothetical protein
MTLKVNTDYRVLANPKRFGGFDAAFEEGDIVYFSRSGHARPDEDGDVQASSRAAGGGTWYILPEFLEEVTITPRPVVATPSGAFVKGNVIRFTVSAELIDGGFRVGCKRSSLVDCGDKVLSYVVNDDKTRATIRFEAEVTDTPNGLRAYVAIPGTAAGRIYVEDAREYLSDIEIVKQAAPPRPDVTLTLTAEEADDLRGLLGQMGYGGRTSGIYNKLDSLIEPGSDQYKLMTSDATPKHVQAPQLVRLSS